MRGEASRLNVRRRPTGVVIRDTPHVSKKKSLNQTQKLKGIQVMLGKEQLAADTKKAIKANKEAHRIQQQSAGSSEGDGITPEVPDEPKGNSLAKVGAEIDWGLKMKVKDYDEDDMDEDDDDRSIDIEETNDDERTNSDNDDQVMNDAERAEEEKDAVKEVTRDEQGVDDQAEDDQVGALIKVTHKEKPEFLLSISTQSLSSNYEIPTVPSAPLLDVLVSVIPEQPTPPTPTPLPTPLIISEAPHITTIAKVDHSEAIEALVHANVINEVKNQLPKAVKDLVELRMESTVQNVLQKDKTKRLHDDQDEDPSAGLTQGKTTKRGRTKEFEPSKKSSTSKETSKGNTTPKASKTDKSLNAEEIVVKPTEVVTMGAEENIVDDMSNVDEQPDGEAAPKTNNAPKNDWFKQPPRPHTPDPEWNKD
ncbi:hypothetical protein Tco_1508533 [Tanacetum coccineum]